MKTARIGSRLAWTLLLPIACAHETLPETEAPVFEPAIAAVTEQVFELAAQIELPALEPAEPVQTAAAPATASEVAELLAAAEQHLDALDIDARVRHAARGPLPPESGLEQAYADQRALVLQGKLEDVREWAAVAKFGSVEPGPQQAESPLARYDLVITRDPRKPIAYLHIVVPERGLAAVGERGRHEAWIDDQRWLNLADTLVPGRDYLPFKTNGHESLHRQWARADLIAAIVDVAAEYRQRTGVPLGIGDLSHVTGGEITDHWTHERGIDVDLYLLDPTDTDDGGRPRVWWNHVKRGVSLWTSQEQGKGKPEPPLDPTDTLSHTPTSLRLETLAEIVFGVDEFAYFVHNDPVTLAPFDEEVAERRPGRRFLHAHNRGYWPTHADHVHLRWVEGELPVGVTPKP